MGFFRKVREWLRRTDDADALSKVEPPERFHDGKDTHRVVICCNAMGFGSRVYIDGKRMKRLRVIDVNCRFDEPTKVTLEMYADVMLLGDVLPKNIAFKLIQHEERLSNASA